MGQMLAPMLQQMNPTGTSIPFTNPSSTPSPPTPAPTPTPSKLFPVRDFITFDTPLKVEGLEKKVEEFNKEQEEGRLTDEEVTMVVIFMVVVHYTSLQVKVVVGVAKGVVRLSSDNLKILLKMRRWE